MSVVYMMDARARKSQQSLVEKLSKILDAAGVEDLVSPGDRVLIKCHMGAPLCTRYLRSFYVRRVADRVRELGAEPIVTDTTGLGLLDPRGTAEKYLKVAAMHGYTAETVNAPIIIADGALGTEFFHSEVQGHRFTKVALANILKEADAVLTLTHFKGHAIAGLGGAVKNLAVGFAGKESKYLMHYIAKPRVESSICDDCQACLEVCPVNAIQVKDGKAYIEPETCIGCKACITKCGRKAVKTERQQDPLEVQLRIADLASAVLNVVGRDKVLFLNFLLEVDWLCDCEHLQQGWSDIPIVPDIGILGSKDPVAIDQASAELVNQAPGIPGSKAEEVGALNPGVDKLKAALPNVDWRQLLKACEKLGVGETTYTLIQPEAGG